MRVDAETGAAYINVLAADKLMQNPRLYATFLLWLLSELFEKLPEVGDPAKPKLVFFFDEAHLLFNDAPKALLDKIEQVVRLIRSKGVGVYFVTQNPLDVPDKVLAQLGNRVQHALRAFTPRDQKAVKAAAETFRPNPKLDTAQVITELGKGEALVSFLEGQRHARRWSSAPWSARLRRAIGPVTPEERKAVMDKSPSRANTTQTSIRIRPTKSCRSASQTAAPARRAGPRPEQAPAHSRRRRILATSAARSEVCRLCGHCRHQVSTRGSRTRSADGSRVVARSVGAPAVRPTASRRPSSTKSDRRQGAAGGRCGTESLDARSLRGGASGSEA